MPVVLPKIGLSTSEYGDDRIDKNFEVLDVAVGTKLNADGSFKTGIIANADISNTAAVAASKLAIQKLYKKSTIANPSATANTDGTQVDLLPAAGYPSVVPEGADVVFGGTFGAETVTATIVVTFSDASTATITKTATATGTQSLTSTDIYGLYKDNVYITKYSVKSKSTIASSVATVTFNSFGFYL
jgi:hypothetical protein